MKVMFMYNFITRLFPARVKAGVLLCVMAGAVSALSGCTKIVVREVEEPQVVEPLTYYYYNDQEYSIHTLLSRYDDGYYYFVAAREPEAPFMSRIELIVPEYNLGKIIDFSDVSLTKGIDYVLLFEDANHYYSPDYAPKSGTLQVRRNSGDASFKVKFDVVLKDGSSLKFDYNGLW